MRHELRTEIEIEAGPEDVWRQLIAIDAYSEWNPFITSGSGTIADGQRLELRMEPPGGKARTFRPVVTVVEPCRSLEWLGRVGLPGTFDGRHRFELVPTRSGTRMLQTEAFRGLLVRPMRGMLDGATRAGFEAMNEALRHRVLDARISD